MCKFCNFEFDENGECWDRIRTVYTNVAPFGHTSIQQKVNMYANQKAKIKSVNLNCEVSVGDDIEDMVFDAYIPINYCPFCGRKLTFPDDEEVEE